MKIGCWRCVPSALRAPPPWRGRKLQSCYGHRVPCLYRNEHGRTSTCVPSPFRGEVPEGRWGRSEATNSSALRLLRPTIARQPQEQTTAITRRFPQDSLFRRVSSGRGAPSGCRRTGVKVKPGGQEVAEPLGFKRSSAVASISGTKAANGCVQNDIHPERAAPGKAASLCSCGLSAPPAPSRSAPEKR